MADDEEYQAEALALAEGFSVEEWAAFRQAEAEQRVPASPIGSGSLRRGNAEEA